MKFEYGHVSLNLSGSVGQDEELNASITLKKSYTTVYAALVSTERNNYAIASVVDGNELKLFIRNIRSTQFTNPSIPVHYLVIGM